MQHQVQSFGWLCISHTVAGRCGALSGLGLSIVKWVAIVKVGNYGICNVKYSPLEVSVFPRLSLDHVALSLD